MLGLYDFIYCPDCGNGLRHCKCQGEAMKLKKTINVSSLLAMGCIIVAGAMDEIPTWTAWALFLWFAEIKLKLRN